MDLMGFGKIEQPKGIGEQEIKKATQILAKYKQGKANLEARIINDELWYKLRHWEAIGRQTEEDDGTPKSPEVTSAWLFNTIANKHADAMDNFPIPAILPREKADEKSAKILTDVLPVILENNAFDETYSRCWWDKLKQGTAVYGIFWNNTKENGLGDIDIKQIDLLNLFWEPGISNIQESQNLFITQLVDNDVLKAQYPNINNLKGNAIDVNHYVYDETIDVSEKSVVVDWYYKKNKLLHYCKFVGDTVLFATENDGFYAQTGLYDHGLYPVVFDVLYPEKDTPVGFGFVSIEKNPQMYIDSLGSNLLESAMIGSKKRFFLGGGSSINEGELCDWNKPLIHVEGGMDDLHIREFTIQPLSGMYVDLMTQKIDEMKETSGNRDMNNGGTYTGVTAASAIAALQEAGNKGSRDMIQSSYRTYNWIMFFCVELIRQFYDEKRTFRITGDDSGYDYTELSNESLKEQVVGHDGEGNELFRKPIFDYKMKAMKRNPFSRMEENERAKELYQLGFFDPNRAQESLMALNMMDFEGVEDIKQKVSEGQTLQNMLQESMQMNEELMQRLNMGVPMGVPMGAPMPEQPPMPEESAPPSPDEHHNGNTMTGEIMRSRVPQKPYAQKLVEQGKMELK